MQTIEINRLLKQKSNFNAGANRKLRRRVRNQLHNSLTGVYQQLRQHYRRKRNNDANELIELAQNEQPIKFKIRAEATDK